MSILSKAAILKENKGNALAIGKEARDAKALDNSIIDSTIGMLYDEDGKFLTFKTVEKASNALKGVEKYSYSSSNGSDEYANALYSWVFRQYLDEFKANTFLRCVATPGGTGALSKTFTNYLNENDSVLLPDYMWSNYIQIAKEANLNFTTFKLFNDDNEFNLNSFEQKCNELKKKQGRVVIVINDPCENPTGYSMSYTDWIGVLQVINSISRDSTPVVLIYDMAYIDYDKRGFDVSRNNIRLFQKFNKSVMTVLCFSGSKTLGLYGLRIGAAIGLAQTEEAANDFFTASDYSARGTWSGTSTLGQNVITKVFTDYYDEFSKELNYARKLLIDRANAFIEESAKVGLNHLPYSCGFFVTIPCEEAEIKFEELKKKGLYLLPIGNALRLTLSSITLKEVIKAVHIIKETI